MIQHHGLDLQEFGIKTKLETKNATYSLPYHCRSGMVKLVIMQTYLNILLHLASPIIYERTLSLFEMMQMAHISHNNLSSNNLRDKHDCSVALNTYSKFLNDSKSCTRRCV